MANVLGRLGSCFIQTPFLPPYANWLGGNYCRQRGFVSGGVFLWGRKSNEFTEYKASSLFLPTGKNRRRTDELFQPLRAYFPVRPGKLLSRISFTVNRSSLHEMSAGVQQINNAVQEVNDLARKNKDSIEGLASEVRKFKV